MAAGPRQVVLVLFVVRVGQDEQELLKAPDPPNIFGRARSFAIKTDGPFKHQQNRLDALDEDLVVSPAAKVIRIAKALSDDDILHLHGLLFNGLKVKVWI